MPDLIKLSDARSWLGISTTDDDAMLQLVISAASDAVIEFLQQDPRSIQTTEIYNGSGSNRLGVNRYPITAIAGISISGWVNQPSIPVDITNVVFTDYSILWRTGVFPLGIKNVTITYTAGFVNLPNPIKMATLITMKAMWNARFVDPNATGESYAGVMSQSFWSSGAGAIPPAAVNLLNPYAVRFKVQ